MNKCIYCNKDISYGIEISESDIIPDALTNKKILFRSVCKVDHNNRFGETFESDVINRLARERNYLGIKNKGNKLPTYKVRVKRGNVVFEKKISRKRDFFNGRGLIPGNFESSEFKLGEVDILSKMKNFDEEKLELINLSEVELQEIHDIDMELFHSSSMLKLVCKIAYEWFCKQFKIFEYKNDSCDVVNFILCNEGMPVAVYSNRQFNEAILTAIDPGSHLIGCFSDITGSYVIYSFWGLVNYKVKVSNASVDIDDIIDAYVIRSDGSDFYCKIGNLHTVEAGNPREVISEISKDILKAYEMMMTQQLMTFKALKNSVSEIEEILNIESLIERRDKLLGYREDNILSAVHILDSFARNENEMYRCYTFNSMVQVATKTVEYIGFNKEDWSLKYEKLFDSGILERNLKTGIEIFNLHI